MPDLLERIALLEPGRQEWLLKVVEKLERTDPLLETPGRMFPGSPQVGPGALERGASGGPDEAELAKGHKSVRLRVLSSWGGGRQVGLTGIAFSDAGAREVKPAHATAGPAGRTGLANLLDGVVRTTSGSRMWVAVLPPGERGVALDFWFPKSPGLDLSTITLWNYNVSLGTLSMGAKEAEIYFRGDLVWRGL